MATKQKLDIYRNAMINIMKLAGVCWDGKRECHDPQEVARKALEEADSKLFNEIDGMKYWKFKVDKKGRVRW